MDEAELTAKLNDLKEQLERCKEERDELKKQLQASQMLHRPRRIKPSPFQIEAESIRESTIETWKEIERKERLYRVTVKGLEAKVCLFRDQLRFFESR